MGTGHGDFKKYTYILTLRNKQFNELVLNLDALSLWVKKAFRIRVNNSFCYLSVLPT